VERLALDYTWNLGMVEVAAVAPLALRRLLLQVAHDHSAGDAVADLVEAFRYGGEAR
jgi:hypothetical protein